MAKTERYAIVYDLAVLDHLRSIDRRHHGAIQTAIETGLSFQPMTRARNRKPLYRSARWAGAWELRCGARNEFRVFYRIDDTQQQVMILAVGVKQRSTLRIAGEEFPQ